MLLKNRSELLFPLSGQKTPIVFEIQSSEPINYSEIKCQIILHLIFFFSRMGWIFCKIIIFTRPMHPPPPNSDNNFLPSQQDQLLFLFSVIGLI